MPIPEAAHALLDAFDNRDRDALARSFAETIRCNGALGATLQREYVLRSLDICSAAFSDFAFNFSDARAEAGVLRLCFAPGGTHDGPLDLNPLGIPLRLPPTGIILRLPASAATLRFNAAGEVAGLALQLAPGAAPRDLIARLGGTLPPRTGV